MDLIWHVHNGNQLAQYNLNVTIVILATVYDKTFEGKHFHSFCGFLQITDVLPLKF